MRIFYQPSQLSHQPHAEMHNGGWAPYREGPDRVQSVLSAVAPPEQPRDCGLAPLTAIHNPEYIEFLQAAHRLWCEAGREGQAMAYAWPIVRRRPLRLDRIDALLGRFSFDAATPVTAETWQSANGAAQSAVAAMQAVADGERHAFALCRPPGHHAGHDYMGGYCYLNNAAIAAQHARVSGFAKVAVLDIDYHHGNGTQDIFWRRGDVLYVSIHADPATDYPFFWGHADEIGEGEGEGATLNLPLVRGADLNLYRRALDRALERISAFAPDALVVSFGADTFVEDPICDFRIRTEDFAPIAADIARCGLPTAIVLEGGYAIDRLGANVTAFLGGFS